MQVATTLRAAVLSSTPGSAAIPSKSARLTPHSTEPTSGPPHSTFHLLLLSHIRRCCRSLSPPQMRHLPVTTARRPYSGSRASTQRNISDYSDPLPLWWTTEPATWLTAMFRSPSTAPLIPSSMRPISSPTINARRITNSRVTSSSRDRASGRWPTLPCLRRRHDGDRTTMTPLSTVCKTAVLPPRQDAVRKTRSAVR